MYVREYKLYRQQLHVNKFFRQKVIGIGQTRLLRNVFGEKSKNKKGKSKIKR